MEAIKDLGADHIRIHLFGEYFQPNPVYISERLVDNLVNLLDTAEQKPVSPSGAASYVKNARQA